MMESSTASLPGNNGHGEEIRPYKIHVSSIDSHDPALGARLFAKLCARSRQNI
jgi:hypothetical protein